MRRTNSVRKSSPVADSGYPRPLLQRNQWINLNGQWDFFIDAKAEWTAPDAIEWDSKITVPFAPETPASGINNTGFYDAVWYRRQFDAPALQKDQRLILHFGAVDYEASVWVNNRPAACHEGGYTPFSADITDLLSAKGPQSIVVRAFDDPKDLSKPRGKQDWQLNPHSIWYPRTTGIWQTVWMEIVSASHISQIRWTPNVERWEFQFEAHIAGPLPNGARLEVKLSSRDRILAHDSYALQSSEVQRTIRLPDPGIDDYRNELLWFPHSPVLIDAQITLRDADGTDIDTVASYTAMRSVSILGDRLILNGRPYKLQLLLDQGYWPDTGLGADDAALKKDVELVKAMGFNGVRKHQKIEDPRFLYWADHLGLVVWEEMPSCYRFSRQTVARLTQQWTEAITRDSSHPCIFAWVPFNESWGVPDLPDSPAQRHCVQALYHLTKTLDPTRPTIGNDGWEVSATDIVGIHDYDADPRRIARRYSTSDTSIDQLLNHERPGNKILLLPGFAYEGQPVMLTEFGGIAFSKDQARTWGYSRAANADDFAARYAHLLAFVRSLPLFSGFCYTQFTDTYQEANGLLYMDRTPKFPLDQIACATRGQVSKDDHKSILRWRTAAAKRLHDIDQSDMKNLE